MTTTRKILLVAIICSAAFYISCKKEPPVYVAAPAKFTILDILKASPSFSLFLEAVHRTKTDKMFSQQGPYTLLIPDNSAFGNIGIKTNQQVDALDTGYLHKLVMYSVIPKAIKSTDVPLALQTQYINLLGQPLYFSQPLPGGFNYDPRGLGPYDQLHVNGDTLVSVDTRASNGYIHVLNSPLKLPDPSVQSFLAADTAYSYFVAGLKKFGLYDQLTGPGPYTILAPSNAAFRANGISLDSLTRLDTLHFKKYLFGVSVLTPHRIFRSDFFDGPVGNAYFNGSFQTINGAFFSKDGILVYYIQNNVTIPYIGFYVLDTVTYNDPYYGPGQYYFLGPYSSSRDVRIAITDPDHIANNGVVHGLGNILVYPDSLTIKH